ncbi:MAG: threonylcarbamoyl-AMP synthase [Rhodothermales bacterium]|nr:threonylcarbamoyl-AMP synthase [Rhodothermales bacterium]
MISTRTRILTDPVEAAGLLREGKLVAFPTETVYGLGADATNPLAVERVYRAKGRPGDNPLIVHLAGAEQIEEVAAEVPEAASWLLEAFAPGPITVIVPRGPSIVPAVSAGLETVGVRVPAHPVARAVLKAAGIPVAAPSANRSGRPSGTTWQAVLADLDGRIDGLLMGERPEVGIESTVVDCSGPVPAVLRTGGISLEQLRDVLPGIMARGERLDASPGTRHPHYAPTARVTVVDAPRPRDGAAYIGLQQPEPGYVITEVVPDLESYARTLYAFFRKADSVGVKQIDCERPPASGIGVALRDRVVRAEAASDR